MVNEKIENILTRRSIRKYQKRDIPEEELNIILECAFSAPSARNQQGWRFVIIRNREILTDISKNIPHSLMLKEAPLAIVVCYEVVDEYQKLYWVQDASASTENILLSANALGIGSVWCSVYPREEKINYIKNRCNLPDEIMPLCVVGLGYPDEDKEYQSRFDTSKIIYRE